MKTIHFKILFTLTLLTLFSPSSRAAQQEAAQDQEGGFTTSCHTYQSLMQGKQLIEEVPMKPVERDCQDQLKSNWEPIFVEDEITKKIGLGFLQGLDVNEQTKLAAQYLTSAATLKKIYPFYTPPESEDIEVHCLKPYHRSVRSSHRKNSHGNAPVLHTDYYPRSSIQEIFSQYNHLFPPHLRSNDEYTPLKTLNFWILLSETAGQFPLGFVEPRFLIEQRLYGLPMPDYLFPSAEDVAVETGSMGELPRQLPSQCMVLKEEDSIPHFLGQTLYFDIGRFFLRDSSIAIPLIYNPHMRKFDAVLFDPMYTVHGPVKHPALRGDRESIEYRCFYFKKNKKATKAKTESDS